MCRLLICAVFFPLLIAFSAPPNVLLIVTDDQGYGDFSIHGNPHLHTPHIDHLGHESVRFDRFYVNSFCAPTRAALLTGRWPLRTGVHGVTHNKEAMKPSETTLAETLRSAGYETACIGKWHNGEQFPYTPQGQGFTDFFGFTNGHWNNYFDATLLRGSQHEPTRGYITDVLTDEALRYITTHQKTPFFCYLAYNAPHSPYQVPDRYYDKFKAKGMDAKVAAFYGMIENIDENIGRILTRLDELKLAENTLVLFLTDNGGTAGVQTYNAGMRGGKTSVHEGGSRVPLFIRWPAAKWQPHVVHHIASHIDVLPTLLDLCGVERPTGPPLDGLSLRPLLEAPTTPAWPERTLFTHNPINETNKYPGAVRTQRHRLVREIKGSSGGSKAKANDASATPWQLYDMEADPAEEHDLAAEQPALVEQLAAKYDAWFADIRHDGLRRMPLPVGHAEHNPVELHAPQAYFDAPLHFASGPGFANDWLTNWTQPKAQVRFELEVHTPGAYEIEISYAASTDAKLRLSTTSAQLMATLPAAEAPLATLPHRDEDGKARYRDRTWATATLGTLHLDKGTATLTLEALSQQPNIDFKQVKLTLK
ncbi:MAG: arylsulfatase [Verrucomicrobiaceae bacterium]|nr:arylsulfatase [Verrucomicrobiaceae bacterium]